MKRTILAIALLLLFCQGTVCASNLSNTEFNPQEGTLELWVTTSWDYDPDAAHSTIEVLFHWAPIHWFNELRLMFWNSQVLAARWMHQGEVLSAEVSVTEWQSDRWYHVAVTWDAALEATKLYIDGELVAERLEWRAPPGASGVSIGTNDNGGQAVEGRVTGAHIFDFAKDADSIRQAFVDSKQEYVPTAEDASAESEELAALAGVWWDHFPIMVNTSNRSVAERFHADYAWTAIADNPGWGLLGQANRLRERGAALSRFQDSGIRHITWFETFGQVENIFLAELRQDSDGEWIRDANGITRFFGTRWSWRASPDSFGDGPKRWIGAHGYFDDLDYHQPLTRTHERYGAPPMRYPDGTVATGYFNDDYMVPDQSRIYDAGGAKNVFGELYAYDLDYHEEQLTFTSIGKDIASPAWLDYHRAALLFALDAGVDAIWSDNYSAWDSFHYPPIRRAFGDWSEATFLDHLANNFTAEELETMGVQDLASFNIRQYLISRAEELGANLERNGTNDWVWRNPQWVEDPIWRAYVIHKRQLGTEGIRQYYQITKETARAEGKDDFLLMGNDIPFYSLGWVRGDLDMVSTEMNSGWHPGSGSRGIMMPPMGRFAPVYKLAREHAVSRFVNVWMYMAKEPEMTRVLYYEGLANHTLPKIEPQEHNLEFAQFVAASRDTWGARLPVEEIGIYYSSSSQLMFMLPGGYIDMDRQPHMFAHYGWGTALEELHYQYRSIPEWKLNRETLDSLKVLIVPNAQVFDPVDVEIFYSWVTDGGILVVTGDSGLRLGESGNFDRNPNGLSLAPLTGVRALDAAPTEEHRKVGDGHVFYLRQNLGMDYYVGRWERISMLSRFADLMATVVGEGNLELAIEPKSVPRTVGLTKYADPAAERLFIDINNMAINESTDTVTPSPATTFYVLLPPWLQDSEVTVSVLTPEDVDVSTSSVSNTKIEITVSPLKYYASVIIEPK